MYLCENVELKDGIFFNVKIFLIKNGEELMVIFFVL